MKKKVSKKKSIKTKGTYAYEIKAVWVDPPTRFQRFKTSVKKNLKYVAYSLGITSGILVALGAFGFVLFKAMDFLTARIHNDLVVLAILLGTTFFVIFFGIIKTSEEVL